MSSVPLRPRVSLFSFDAETGSRRPRWFAVLAGFLVLLLAAAGIVAGVSAANAHTPRINADCYALTVDLTQYNGTNSVYVKINDEVKTDQTFGNSFSQTYTFDDPTVINTYTVIVVAHDDKDFRNGWSVKKENKTTTPCAAPELTLGATVCDTVGGTTTLTATISKLVTGQRYTGQLFRNGTVVDTFEATTAGKTWPAMQAGVTYRLTVTSDSNPGLTKSIETYAVGCPQNSNLQVTVNECTATGSSNAAVAVVASSVVPGRSYTATVYQGNAPYAGVLPYTFTPAAGETSVSFTISGLPESVTGLTVVLSDANSAATITSTTFATAPCPDVPDKPAVTANECTVVGGSLELTVQLSGLVPTRAYEIWINGAKADEFVATATSEGPRVYPVGAGTYTVTVLDTLVPGATAASDPIEVKACPTQPKLALAVTECAVPGGTGSLTATFADLGAGREYLVTITEGAGNAVPGYVTAVTVTSASAPQAYSGLAANASYTVTIVDKLATNVKSAASATLKPCPDTPTIAVAIQCEVVSNTTYYGVTLDKLQGGQQYEVTIVDDAGNPAAPPVTVTGGAGGVAPTFQVPNGEFYTLTVTSLANSAISASIDVFAAVCDLPTFPLPPEFPELPTLALTGAGDTTMPMLGALGLVQFGVALLALAAMLQFSPTRRRA